jgi:arginyl-tRNA synthetase
MSKRRGDVVLLDELIDEIGVDAARWYLVSRGPDQMIDIDVDLAKEASRKNPVYYVQYVHARTSGIFREAGAEPTVDPVPRHPLDEEERALVKRLLEFPEVARLATERRAPQLVTDYAIRLADDFHRFYHDRTRHQVVGSPEQPFRLALTGATQAVIARSLDLVGVEAPARM